jgi:hypothetical protein
MGDFYKHSSEVKTCFVHTRISLKNGDVWSAILHSGHNGIPTNITEQTWLTKHQAGHLSGANWNLLRF